MRELPPRISVAHETTVVRLMVVIAKEACLLPVFCVADQSKGRLCLLPSPGRPLSGALMTVPVALCPQSLSMPSFAFLFPRAGGPPSLGGVFLCCQPPPPEQGPIR